jgi:hypothetical protein
MVNLRLFRPFLRLNCVETVVAETFDFKSFSIDAVVKIEANISCGGFHKLLK